MKNLILSLLLTLPFLVHTQTPDTATVRVEIDSLIELNKNLVKERKLDKALQVIQQAEKKCLATFGEETALYASLLNNIGKTYYYKGEISKVESFWLKAKDIREKVFGKEHTDYAASLINVASLYTDLGQYEKAEPLYLEAKAIREKALGKEHPDYATSLFKLAILYHEMGQYEKAKPLYLEAKAIREKTLGKEHPNYASSLNSLAILYYSMGQYEKAEPLYVESLTILEKTLGKEHRYYASSLNNLANLYKEMSQYEKAKSLLLEAKAIREKTSGKEHPTYASSLNNLAIIYYSLGQYEKAEPLYLEAKAIRETILGREHPEYATSLNNLAVLYVEMGQYEKAEPLHLEAKTVREKALGKEHPDYAASLNNLANLYKDIGQNEKAELLYLEVKATEGKVLGKEHPDYAACLDNLAILYLSMGLNEKAENLLLESKVIRGKALGKQHPDYATSLVNLAILYRRLDQYEKAENLLLESLGIREKAQGKEHARYAKSLGNLANLYKDMGQYDKAESLHLESTVILEKALGKENPDYTSKLNSLALLYRRLDQYDKAESLHLEANELEKTLLLKASLHLSEKELFIYSNEFINRQSSFLSFAQIRSGLSQSAYDNSLFYKGFLLNATQQVNRLAQTDSLSNELFLRLKGYNRRLAKAYSNPVAERDSSKIAELEEKANSLEKELTRSVAGFGEALRQVSWEEVQTSLNPGEVAIEFVHYQFHNPEPTDSVMYVAQILRPEDEQPQFIPLFEEKQLQQVLSGKDQTENIALAYGTRGVVPKKKKSLKGLYSLIWQPLEEQLKGVKKVYYSPSGLLHRINFDAIPAEQNKTLADEYQLTRLGSTRSLVVPDLTKPNPENEAVLYGGIEYEIQETLAARGKSIEEKPLKRSAELSFSYADRSLDQRGDSWNYLPGTKTEVENIDELLNQSGFKPITFSEMQATEESFKAMGAGNASPRVLHLATHGYFFPDPKNDNQSTINSEDPVFKISDHPMIRSGLILAGGNHAWKTGKAMYPDMEDGILTAYEISQMDLSHTELVVLSACETGLGDIEGNEGVYGLQRAFKIAGAKYLIMSLWQVPDSQTKDFMVTFYRHYLEDKMTIPDAFRKTQQKMKKRFSDPYLWAGFVLVE